MQVSEAWQIYFVLIGVSDDKTRLHLAYKVNPFEKKQQWMQHLHQNRIKETYHQIMFHVPRNKLSLYLL